MLLAMTYVVVVFSILVQGLTIGPLARQWMQRGRATAARRGRTGLTPTSRKRERRAYFVRRSRFRLVGTCRPHSSSR